MHAKVWGCRGSLATPGAATIRYGGNTTCLEIRAPGGEVVVLDAGTGIRALGNALHAEALREADLLLTHLHLDHVEGLGFFEPLFDPDFCLRIWGPRPDGGSLEQELATYLSPPFFPLPFAQIPARIEFTEIEAESWTLAGLRVSSAPVRHRGPTLGYRLADGDRSMAFLPDNEPALEPESGLALAGGAEVLFHDAQYTADEYTTRVGWGHTGLPDFAAFVAAAAPGATMMFHHDPAHSDDQLEAMEADARELTGMDNVSLAFEGLAVELG
jgi:phosphoribosyl 1,2-cyclic phosphodiesterase